jgi:hypothetical protein
MLQKPQRNLQMQLLFEEAKRLVAALDFNRDDGPASSTG